MPPNHIGFSVPRYLRTALLAAGLLAAGEATAQVTSWTPLLVGNPLLIYGAVTAPILGTSIGSTAPAPWVGAMTTAPANLGSKVASAMDGAGNIYAVYGTTVVLGLLSPYFGYASKTTPADVTYYFGLTEAPADFAVNASGEVYILDGILDLGTVYRLNPDGSTTTLGTLTGPNGGIAFANAMSADEAENVSITVIADNLGDGPQPAVYFFEADGPVPDFSGTVGLSTYLSPPSPPTSTFMVPFSPSPTYSLSAVGATASLPVTYQWYLDGTAISGATQDSYDGPFLEPGTYSVIASTAAGTVTSSATLDIYVDGYAAGPEPLVTQVPATVGIPFGSTATLTASAVATLPVSFQWYLNGVAIAGADSATPSATTDGLYSTSFIASQPGAYSVTASTTAGTATSDVDAQWTIAGVAAGPTPVFISPPATVAVAYLSTTSLTASAGATLPVSFQWYLNGVAIAGADAAAPSTTTAGLCSTSLSASQPGVYTVVATTSGGGGGSLSSPPATLTVLTSGGLAVEPAPAIVAQPQSAAFSYGGVPTLSVGALATLPLAFQWQLNGVDIPGATQSSYASGESGAFTVVVTTTAGSVTSSPAVVALADRPVDISARAEVGTGEDACIAGFVVASYSGAPKQVLVRAVGPTLSEFNVPGVLAQPVLTVRDGSGNVVASNTGWGNSTAIAAAAATAGAFALPAGSADAALLLELSPGSYTAEVTGADGTTGVALVEVYEVAADSGHLINISNRASVGTGADILIGGFVLGGTQPSQVLVRAVGPGLSQFGVSGVLAQPVLSIYDSNGDLIAINVGWSSGGSAEAVAVADAAVATGGFPLAPGSADCGLLLLLPPGSYTAQVTGVGDSTGIALVEVYQVPQ